MLYNFVSALFSLSLYSKQKLRINWQQSMICSISLGLPHNDTDPYMKKKIYSWTAWQLLIFHVAMKNLTRNKTQNKVTMFMNTLMFLWWSTFNIQHCHFSLKNNDMKTSAWRACISSPCQPILNNTHTLFLTGKVGFTYLLFCVTKNKKYVTAYIESLGVYHLRPVINRTHL